MVTWKCIEVIVLNVQYEDNKAFNQFITVCLLSSLSVFIFSNNKILKNDSQIEDGMEG
jgi:hypothetical protein